MYALMYPILYIASIHCYIPLSTATSMSVCSVCIVLWHDHVNGEITALNKKGTPALFIQKSFYGDFIMDLSLNHVAYPIQ